MEKILIVSKNPEARQIISKALGDQYRVFIEKQGKTWMDCVAKDRYEITFIDIDFLQKLKQHDDYKTFKKVLQIFKRPYPTVSIVVMAFPEIATYLPEKYLSR